MCVWHGVLIAKKRIQIIYLKHDVLKLPIVSNSSLSTFLWLIRCCCFFFASFKTDCVCIWFCIFFKHFILFFFAINLAVLFNSVDCFGGHFACLTTFYSIFGVIVLNLCIFYLHIMSSGEIRHDNKHRHILRSGDHNNMIFIS